MDIGNCDHLPRWAFGMDTVFRATSSLYSKWIRYGNHVILYIWKMDVLTADVCGESHTVDRHRTARLAQVASQGTILIFNI